MVSRKGKVVKRAVFVIVNTLMALVLLVIPLIGCKISTSEGIWQEPIRLKLAEDMQDVARPNFN